MVDGIFDPKTSHLQKCLAFEHLYFLACGDQFVLPFSFLVNLLLFTITNSKLAWSVVSKILPGCSYKTVTGWRDSLASVPLPFPSGDCVTAFDNDQIVQQKWKAREGQKACVSILRSIFQAVVDEGGSLQKREDWLQGNCLPRFEIIITNYFHESTNCSKRHFKVVLRPKK